MASHPSQRNYICGDCHEQIPCPCDQDRFEDLDVEDQERRMRIERRQAEWDHAAEGVSLMSSHSDVETAREMLRGEGCDCDPQITVLATEGSFETLRYRHSHAASCVLARRLGLQSGDDAIGTVTLS